MSTCRAHKRSFVTHHESWAHSIWRKGPHRTRFPCERGGRPKRPIGRRRRSSLERGKERCQLQAWQESSDCDSPHRERGCRSADSEPLRLWFAGQVSQPRPAPSSSCRDAFHLLNQKPTLRPMQPSTLILAQVRPNQKQMMRSGKTMRLATLLAEVSKAAIMRAEPTRMEPR